MTTPDATNHPETPHVLDLTSAAARAREALGLKRTPLIYRREELAFQSADRTGDAVMLGEGAFWVVCPADAQRLERAGYE